MTKSWGTLPVEILDQIFADLTLTSDIQQTRLVCKPWTAAAQSKLYENVQLFDEKHAKLFVQSVENSPKQEIGMLVKTIALVNTNSTDWRRSYYWSPDLRSLKSIVTSFMELCPKVQLFKVPFSSGIGDWFLSTRWMT
jgi:hypothetical protein